jgi:diguanylate cyclase (GGDEF)-like protein
LLVIALSVSSFAIPALGFYRRTRQKQAVDEHVRFLAHHDVLTKLPNRSSFMERVNHGLVLAGKNRGISALHFIDIDLFKEVNDSFGHDAGDQLLTTVASRLRDILREDDIVSRFGGDEFVIAQFGFDNDEQIQTAIKRMMAILREPYRLKDRELHVTFSVGTALAPADGGDAETLVKHADIALYAVKASGRNGQRRFDVSLDEQLQKRLRLETIVREAAHRQSFGLHFQPLFTVGSVELTGFEALLRLNGPDGAPISPSAFIPIAENTGLIDEIGGWVVRRACQTAAQWPNGLQISVNLSAVQFHRKSVCDTVRRALSESGLAPHRLVLEITESLLLAETDSVLAQLNELKAMGVAIAMDDFGSGYSSLGYMLRFPFDRIKIDRSFVKALTSGDSNAKTVIQTIISLGHTLNMKVTAEGVETLTQADQLRNMACDDAQGFLFGRPMPETDIAAVILRQFAGKTLVHRQTSPFMGEVAASR